MSASALGFVVVCTLRNRVARQLARLRQPRYAVAMLVGVAFFWMIYFQPSDRRGASAASPTMSASMLTLFAAGLGATVLFWWLRGGVASALAFQPAEVQFLFTAPLGRRALIAYRIARSQLLILFNALIWMVLLRQWGVSLSAPLRFFAVWALLTTLSLHRLGTALVQVEPLTPWRRTARLVARGVAIVIAVTFVAGLVPVLRAIPTMESGAARTLMDAVSVPPSSWALAPFALLMAPMSASGAMEWGVAFAPVLALIAVHLAWVLSMNVRFEEAAATASTELAQRIAAIRGRRGLSGAAAPTATAKSARRRIPLRPTGNPMFALVWKNTMALIRGGGGATILRLAAFAVAALFVVPAIMQGTSGVDTEASTVIGWMPMIMMIAVSFFVGPRMLRNDLRHDLPSLSLLKTYPLSGSQVVLAELLSPTIALTAFQLVLIVAASVALPAEARETLSGTMLVAALLVTPIVLVAVNATNLVIQNGVTLAFPGWVRLGMDTGGLEAMGQNLLVMIATMVALMVALIVPVIAGGVVFVSMQSTYGSLTVVVAILAGAVTMLVQVWGLLIGLGRVFERTEPSGLL